MKAGVAPTGRYVLRPLPVSFSSDPPVTSRLGATIRAHASFVGSPRFSGSLLFGIATDREAPPPLAGFLPVLAFSGTRVVGYKRTRHPPPHTPLADGRCCRQR
eukprot:6149072-Prymnesium_polylepis.2